MPRPGACHDRRLDDVDGFGDADKVAEGVVGADKDAKGVGADKVAERVGAENNPEEEKPDDRDDEEDGELGTPMKDNPAYKGDWHVKRISDPACEEGCDVPSLRIARCKVANTNLSDYKVVMPASLRVRVKDWSS